jgi:hypothetical protein
MSPKGIASPHTTHGRYSKVLPARLLPTYEAAQNDPDLLALSAEIHVIDSRIADVLGRVDTGESGETWRAANKAYQDMLAARASNEPLELIGAEERLKDLLAKGLHDSAAWDEVLGLVERRRKLVESERKRLLEAQQYVTVERALLYTQALLESVKSNVSDPAILNRIQTDFSRLVGATSYPQGADTRRAD